MPSGQGAQAPLIISNPAPCIVRSCSCANSACLRLINNILALQIRSATADKVELEVVWDDPHGGELLEVFAVRTGHPPNINQLLPSPTSSLSFLTARRDQSSAAHANNRIELRFLSAAGSPDPTPAAAHIAVCSILATLSRSPKPPSRADSQEGRTRTHTHELHVRFFFALTALTPPAHPGRPARRAVRSSTTRASSSTPPTSRSTPTPPRAARAGPTPTTQSTPASERRRAPGCALAARLPSRMPRPAPGEPGLPSHRRAGAAQSWAGRAFRVLGGARRRTTC
jgi:hypothetical protein